MLSILIFIGVKKLRIDFLIEIIFSKITLPIKFEFKPMRDTLNTHPYHIIEFHSDGSSYFFSYQFDF